MYIIFTSILFLFVYFYVYVWVHVHVCVCPCPVLIILHLVWVQFVSVLVVLLFSLSWPSLPKVDVCRSDQRLQDYSGLMSQPSGRAHIPSEDTQACSAFRVMWPSVLQADWLTAVVWGWGQLNVVCRVGVSVSNEISWEQDMWKFLWTMTMMTKWKVYAESADMLCFDYDLIPWYLNWVDGFNAGIFLDSFCLMAPVTLVVGLVWSSWT